MRKSGWMTIALALFWTFLGFSQVNADVFAKERESELLFGRGVHAFFDNDYKTAVDLLKRVEDSKSEDPRPYYFLALSYAKLKKEDLADAAFKKAAKLEWEGRSAKDYNIGDALRRVQGNERLRIEAYREQAKVNWEKSEKRIRKEKYAKEETDEKAVLATIAKSFVGAAPFGARSLDPQRKDFAEDQGRMIPQKELPVSAKPEGAAEAKTEEKKSDEAKEEKKSDEDDPFGDTKPAAGAMNEEKKSDEAKEEKKSEGEDPFGDTKPAAGAMNEEKMSDEAKEEKKSDENNSNNQEKKDGAEEKKEEKKDDESDPFQ